MNRPFVVCHMLCSMDGKIEGSFMAAPEALSGLAEYGKLREFYLCTAILYGTTTMEEGYSDGLAPKLEETGEEYPMEDYVAPTDVKNYIVSLDPAGILGASLVIVPLVSGNNRAASVFEQASFLPEGGAAAFTLKDVKRMEGNSLWLRYIRQA